MESRLARFLIKAGTGVALAFLYGPLVILALYAFNKGISHSWPPDLWTTKWFTAALHDDLLGGALKNSVLAADRRHDGRADVGFARGVRGPPVHVLRSRHDLVRARPADRAARDRHGDRALVLDQLREQSRSASHFGLLTIIVGHATFCIVVVFNNVIARLRRTPTSLVEASMDLGADGWQTFRYVTFPALRTALVAGGLLAFGLSFDEIVVTNFTAGSTLTLPLWIFNNIRLPKQQPVVNAVALVLMLLSIVPVYFAQRLAGGGQAVGAVARGGSATPVAALDAAGPG